MQNNLWSKIAAPRIIDELEKILDLKLTNLCLQRASYINRVFEFERADNKERIIVKFYRPGRWTKDMILAEQQLIAKLSEEELPVIPPLKFNNKTLFQLDNISFAVFSKKGGRAIDEFDKDTWILVGRILGRIHLITQSFADINRIIWEPAIATKHHLEVLEKEKIVPLDYQKILFNLGDLFIRKFNPHFQETEKLVLHGDSHRGNFIYRPGEGIFVIDFDDISIGPVVQDLWMLLPAEPQYCKQEIQWFLEGYETFKHFPVKTLKLIPALRAMRLIHFSAWCAIQAQEPEFKNSFPEWGSLRYWNELVKDLQQIVY